MTGGGCGAEEKALENRAAEKGAERRRGRGWGATREREGHGLGLSRGNRRRLGIWREMKRVRRKRKELYRSDFERSGDLKRGNLRNEGMHWQV